jgi:glycosyltransferase involved in cell wall biosynthesis
MDESEIARSQETVQNPEISVIIPVYNAAATLQRCLDAVTGSLFRDVECIVIDDGSTDGSQDIAGKFPVHFLQLNGGPYGPAYARNQGANLAAGKILFFIDADVIIYPDTLSKVSASFERHPLVDAVFGSYDRQPGDGSFISQYKNLMHHFVHQQSREEASTFWSGCGAMKREVFQHFGGFDVANYSRPSIEDIELGARLASKGHKIWLNKDLQVKHLKRWTLKGLIKTDVFDRAIPWTNVILRNRDLPNDLNLSVDQRISAILAAFMTLFLAISVMSRNYWLLPILGFLFLLIVNFWNWGGSFGFYEMRPANGILTLTTIVVTAILAYFTGMIFLLPPLLWILACTLAIPFLIRYSPTIQKIVFALMLSAIIVDLVLLLLSYPVRFLGVLLVFIIAIVILNNRLYVFFFHQRGAVFTLAVFPMHMLYYLYSIVAFLISISMHYWHEILTPKLGT